MSTHKEKDAQIKDLKTKIREKNKELKELRKAVESHTETIEEFPLKGLGMLRVDKTYYIVNLSYDEDANAARIDSRKSLGVSFPTAVGRARMAFADIIDKARKDRGKE